MGKSLADQIAEIANKPKLEDFDIENEDAVFRHQESGSDSGSDSDEQLEKEHYVSMEKSKLREAVDRGISVKDKRYTGSKSSRAALFEQDLDEPLEGESESEDGLERDANSPVEESEVESTGEEDEEEDNDSDSEEDDSEEDEEDDEETEEKRNRLANLVQNQNKEIVTRLSQSTQKDASKGFAILEQNKFFDNILDSRIKLQKALNASNKLPLTESSWKQLCDEKNAKLLSSTVKVLEKVVAQCLKVRHKFQLGDNINQNEDKDRDIDFSKKRSFRELCQETHKLDADLKQYRTAVLNKWSTKISAASGRSALQSSKFKAINQPADVQVENQLSDLPRLLKRTKLNRTNVKPLLFDKDLENGLLSQLQPHEGEEGSEDDEGLDIPKNYDPRRKDNNAVDLMENPYIFDDEDFYRVLLNDLVEKKISNSQQQGSGVTIAITSRSQNKLKKNVDTKASKGRKLNFSVQEPIANYEAPVNNGFRWSDEQIDEFFAGLLGQKVNFNENDSAESSGDENDPEEQQAIKNDDIQIFG